MKLELGGKTFEVKEMTLNQVKELEDRGVNLMSFSKEDAFKMSYIGEIVHVLIKKQDKDVTLEWVGEKITMSNFAKVSEKVTTFLAPKGGQAKPTT